MRIETLNRYNEPGRIYHSLRHLATMFDIAGRHELKLSKAQVIAICHHDTVYKFGSAKNEEMSAKLMYKEEKDFYSTKILDEAYKIILSTARHFPLCDSAKDVIDLDLYGLAQDDYWNIRDMVSREYLPIIGSTKWEKERAKWLEYMLNKPTIYYGFYEGNDHKAKANLRKELHQIRPSITVPNGDGVVVEEKGL